MKEIIFQVEEDLVDGDWPARALGKPIFRWLLIATLVLSCPLPVDAAEDESTMAAATSNLSGQSLNVEELEQLKSSLSIVHFGEYAAAVQAKKYQDRRIAPDLITIIRDNTALMNIRISAIWVLAKTGDPVGVPVLKAMIDEPLLDNVDKKQTRFLQTALLCIGMFGDEQTLDFLENVATTEAYWLERNAQAAMKNNTPENFRHHMRTLALNSLALSGNQRAIDLLETCEGVPEDLRSQCKSLLKVARMRNLGYIRVEDYENRNR